MAEPIIVDFNDPKQDILVDTNGYNARNYDGFSVEFDPAKQKQHDLEVQKRALDQYKQRSRGPALSVGGQSALVRAGS